MTRGNDTSPDYTAIYLSPHLDDAVLSCGGAIAARSERNEPVLVVTMCTAQPTHISAYAEWHHRDSALSNEEAVSVRLAEDVKAMNYLGASHLWLGLEDAIYRKPDIYNTDEALFGTMVEESEMIEATEQALIQILEHCTRAEIYAPLGVGLHVDHQVAYSAAVRLQTHGKQVRYYEDIPYVLRPGALEQRLGGLSSGGDAHFRAELIEMGGTLEKKLEAIRCYASQLGDLNAIQAHASALAGGSRSAERIWHRSTPR